MRLVSATSVVAFASVVAVLGGLLVFAKVVVPLLPNQEQETDVPRYPTATPATALAQPTPLSTLVSRPAVPLTALSPPSLSRNSMEFYSLPNARPLEQRNPFAARTIMSLPWVADGMSDEERDATESLVYIAATQEELFDQLANKTWLPTSVVQETGPVILGLEYIASEAPTSALSLVAMPFLDHLQPADVLAVDSLSHLAYLDFNAFRKVMDHPTVSDGITDGEAKIVGLLGEAFEFDPALPSKLLDPAETTIEERAVDLPLAGEITLAIIRTGPGTARSMDLLESAVRTAESFIGEPFPNKYVALLFEEALPGNISGTNNGVHMTILPEYDIRVDSYGSLLASRVIAHEVAHFYWHGGEAWLDEGAAEVTAAFGEQVHNGHPLEPVNYPCGATHTIRFLEMQDSVETDAGYLCNYAVGERFFLDLYGKLGEEQFRQGFRNLYLTVKKRSSLGGNAAGMAEVLKAFAGLQSREPANAPDRVLQVAERWYEGKVPDRYVYLDTRPVVAELPTVNGWINRAYVSLAEGGKPVSAFSPTQVGNRVWLTLEYSHDYAGPPQELTFEVVENYEDGFPYRRSTLTIQANRRYSGGVQWISVGPGPEQKWAQGQHWVYVYHGGRKVAEVQFEVVP